MFQPGRHFLGLSTLLVLGMLLLPHLSPAQSNVTSNDPNFTPSVLKSGLSFPDGVVFRPPTGDLLVSQSGNNQISTVDATSGMFHSFATTSAAPDKIAVRASDGLVAVMTGTFGPVAFFSSTGVSQGTANLGAAIIAAFPSAFAGTTVACLSGLSFDTAGNLFVAAGPGSTESNGCPVNSTWAVYEFAAAAPASATPTQVTTFPGSVVIQDMVFSAARPPLGTLYALDSEGGNVFEISLGGACGEFGICPTSIATVDVNVNPRGIAVDPLLGDLYVTEFDNTEILKIPAHGNQDGPSSPTPFATGFSGNTLRLAFDTQGNLYVNEIGVGNLWKLTRASNATTLQPLTAGKINALTFINPNPAMSDQIQTILIPASANLNGAAFIQDIFVSVDPATLNATLSGGTTGDTAFFGGAPVPAGTTCAQVPSAASPPTHPNCVVVIQKCYDANHHPFEICPVQEPTASTDLIQLTFTYAGAQTLTNPAFLIGFDNGDGQDITDITIADCCSGGTKSLCSKTFDASLPAGSGDFSLAISPDPVNLTTSSPTSATVTVTSPNSFASTIALVVSDIPAGFTASLSPTSVGLSGGSTASSGLTVGIASSATTSSVTTTIANLLAAGCIDNAGIANAFTSKLSATQANISTGQIQTAINVLMAFEDQVQAQSGKHISALCTTVFPLIVKGTATNGEVRLASANITFTPATVLTTEVAGLITSLKTSVSSADPITGFVVDSTGTGVLNVTISILNSPSNTPAVLPVNSDLTGFYFFATTSSLTVGSTYTIQVTGIPAPFSLPSPSFQTFIWTGKGLAFNFTLQ
jgi:sugar lactone lactonase YvrE